MKAQNQTEHKTCGRCGKIYASIPVKAVKDEMGYFYDCSCGNTLFWGDPELMAKIRAQRKTQ